MAEQTAAAACRRWLVIGVTALVAVACGGADDDTAASSTTAPVSVPAGLSELDFCRQAFRNAQAGLNPSLPPEPYQVCSRADFFRVTLEDAGAKVPGYDAMRFGAERLGQNCDTYRALGPEPKACIGAESSLGTGVTAPPGPRPAPTGPADAVTQTVYEWTSPSGECCAPDRTEETGTFTLAGGKWKVVWSSFNIGRGCAVTGSVIGPDGAATGDTFGPAALGTATFVSAPGTYSLRLREECPEADSVMKVSLTVIDLYD